MINTKDLIGIRKYEALKSYDFDKMSVDEMVYFRKIFKISVAEAEKKIADYEMYKNKNTNSESNKEYFKKLRNLNTPEKRALNKKELWHLFINRFKSITGVELIKSDDFIYNIKPLFYYFTNDIVSFKNCLNVSKLSEPSLNKGLLICGDYGNGKSTIMKVLEKCFIDNKKYYKGYSANEVVLKFESCKEPSDREYLIKSMSKGTLYFDDIKSERMANNYGKSELFREILENRYNNKAKTFITCNYKKGYEGDLQMALQEFGEKYGDRVNDRLYEMFNIIEFKGKSFRV